MYEKINSLQGLSRLFLNPDIDNTSVNIINYKILKFLMESIGYFNAGDILHFSQISDNYTIINEFTLL